MKKLCYLLLASLIMLAGCAEGYDDAEIFDKYNDLQKELNDLEEKVEETQKLLNALANNLTISSVKESSEGYVVTFSDGSAITVKHGKDGANGKDGTNGKDGANGKDGKDGADGKDGVAGKDGKDGNSVIQDIEVGNSSVTFTLTDGQVVIIPLGESIAQNNKIYYTTTDGKKLFPHDSDPVVFGAILESNTYENGQGVMTFDETVTSIGIEAFYTCDNLESIIIPDGVTLIERGAFQSCDNLKSVSVGTSVISIELDAFSYCPSLTSITLPDGLTSISGNAFIGSTNLTEFKGKHATEDGRCIVIDGVLKCFAPYGITEYTIPAGVTSIGENAFKLCSSLTNITIPASVTSIGQYAFGGCSNLVNIQIPNSVSSIGGAAFSSCTNLESITIPNSVTSIEDVLFYCCKKLVNVTIPAGVTSIGYNAFGECTSLENITIPTSVTSIGQYAFGECTSLSKVYCKPAIPPTGGVYMFENHASEFTIYVPNASVDAYKSAEHWSNYYVRFEGYNF